MPPLPSPPSHPRRGPPSTGRRPGGRDGSIRAGRVFSALAVVIAVFLAFTLHRVVDPGMLHTLAPGDWVAVLPTAPSAGDVVLLSDPLEPSRDIFRRVLATGGSRVEWSGGVPVVDGMAHRQLVLHTDEDRTLLLEGGRALLAVDSEDPQPTERAPVRLLPGELWLAADQRDIALDSRHWGPMPREVVRGTVWLRMGPSSPWRSALHRP